MVPRVLIVDDVAQVRQDLSILLTLTGSVEVVGEAKMIPDIGLQRAGRNICGIRLAVGLYLISWFSPPAASP